MAFHNTISCGIIRFRNTPIKSCASCNELLLAEGAGAVVLVGVVDAGAAAELALLAEEVWELAPDASRKPSTLLELARRRLMS